MHIRRLCTAVPLLIGIAAIPAFADINFTTSGTSGGNAVSGSADFSIISPGVLQIVITNTTGSAVNPLNQISEVLDGLAFTLTGGSGFTLTNVSAAGGFEDCTGVNCVGVGTFTDYTNQAKNDPGCGGKSAPATCTSPYTWGLNSGVLAAGNGSLAPGGIVNGTITSFDGIPNSEHNDYLVGPATFTIGYSGTLTGVSGVTFEWGTTPATTAGTQNGGTGTLFGSPVPEPGSILLLGSAVMIAASRFRRKIGRNC